VGDNLTNPLLIVEVRSESTEDCDRGSKFHQYRQIPSFQEYLTVWQTGTQIDHSVRQPDGSWLLREVGPQNIAVTLKSLCIELALTDIYEKVSFNNGVIS
jgi:Uma2 family endonuclease